MSMAAAQHRVEFEDLPAAFRLAQSNVANARWWSYQDECFRLAAIIRGDDARKRAIVEFMHDLATSNGLVVAHGEGIIHQVISAALREEA